MFEHVRITELFGHFLPKIWPHKENEQARSARQFKWQGFGKAVISEICNFHGSYSSTGQFTRVAKLSVACGQTIGSCPDLVIASAISKMS